MIVRRVFPETGPAIEVESTEAREQLGELYALAGTDILRINLVASVSGSAAGGDATSETLTNRADRKILGVIRRDSDVVLVGAASVRAEGYQLPRTAPLAIVTSTGDLGGHRLTVHPDRFIPFVLCPAAVAEVAKTALPSAEIVVVPDAAGRMSAVDIVSALRLRGLRRIVCEGGPSLAAQMLEAGLVDELCLSTSPIVGGVSLPLLGSSPIAAHRLELAQLLVDDTSTLYARWRVLD
ncbi:pyrimidine reductase [Glaciihabitans sp. INWT7]|uniref:dihydrofolate reductase family protein n=1 Tax=Glaciihabitans sp. INWT7 TaxID=2596912 RepID=UPI00162329B9|nr:dihydrofolate reductase family protein [Glaciihabitans sp. INWT7]QNE46927.1 pyrimidine reductase [Glaciihabitans sp. INWT7]